MALTSFASRTPGTALNDGFRLDLNALGGDACALLDDAGRVVALNDNAAELLGRPKHQMLGTRLGSWEPHQREAAIRIFCPEKRVNATGVMRLLRVTEAADQGPISLTDAVCLATLEANALRESRPFTVTAPGLPGERVPSTWIAALRSWLTFLADLDERGPAQVEVSAQSTGAEWLEIEMRLLLQSGEERPAEFDSTGMDSATLLLQELSGRFELSVDHPLVMVKLCLPLPIAGSAA